MGVRRCDTRSYSAASVPSWDAPDALFRIGEGGEHHLAQRLEGGLKVVANDLQQVTQQQHAQLAVHSRRRGLHALCDGNGKTKSTCKLRKCENPQERPPKDDEEEEPKKKGKKGTRKII